MSRLSGKSPVSGVNFLSYQSFLKTYNLVSNSLALCKSKSGTLTADFFKEYPYENTLEGGVQGFLLKFRNGLVLKVSNSLDFVVLHEYLVMKSLNSLRKFCPHFAATYGVVKLAVSDRYADAPPPNFEDLFGPAFGKKEVENGYRRDPDSKKDQRDPDSKKEEGLRNPLAIYGLVNEFIPEAEVFSSALAEMSSQEVYSSTISILLALEMAQRIKKFTHYDLHVDNVLITPIHSNTVFVYLIPRDGGGTEVFWVPTFGNLPVVIDFGFSYTSDLKGKRFNTLLQHTDSGYLPMISDPVADVKVFLSSLCHDLKEKDDPKFQYFTTTIGKLFKPLHIDQETGWDKIDNISMTEYLANLVMEGDCHLFRKKEIQVTEILNGLLILPLIDYSDVEDAAVDSGIKILADELRKVDYSEEIKDEFHLLYLFYKLVDLGRYYISLTELPPPGSSSKSPPKGIPKKEILRSPDPSKKSPFAKKEPEVTFLPKGSPQKEPNRSSPMTGLVDPTRVAEAARRDWKKRVQLFGESYITAIADTLPYYTVPFDFNRVLTALVSLSKTISSGYVKILGEIRAEKVKDYQKLPLKRIPDIVRLITTNFTPTYLFNRDTRVYFWDSVQQRSTHCQIPERLADALNKMNYRQISKVLGERLYPRL